MSKIITLTTDFGLADEYVGVMKGVILNIAPAAVIVDLCHAVDRHNLRYAAWLVGASWRYFPNGTIHLVVVDPGVGGNRRLILVRAGGHTFLAPDNGVLTPVIRDHFKAAFAVTNEEYFLNPVSSTFHGRDILAPVAARLAKGLAATAVGESLPREALAILDHAGARLVADRGTITGEILAADRFGNLLTNISAEQIGALVPADVTPVIRLKAAAIHGMVDAYCRVPAGEPLAIIGSRGFLEIAVNQGSAAGFTGARPGDPVVVCVGEA